MKTPKLILALVLFAMTFIACNPKEDEPTRENSGRQLTALHENLLNDAMQTATLDAATGGTLTGNQGTQFVFPANAFQDGNGNTITGTVNVEYAELYKRSDMVLMNKPTMGELLSGDKAWLVTGGEFYVKVTQAACSCEIQIVNPFEIKTNPNPDPTAFDNNMIGFRGEIVADELTWIQMGEGATGQGFIPVGVRAGLNGSYYSLFSSENGWTNIDRFASDPRPKTTLEVTVPAGFDDDNCTIYLSVDGDDAGIATLDVYNAGVFSEHYGQLPIGLEAHLIFVSVDDDETIRHQIKPITVTAGQQEHIDNVTTISQADLQTAIDALP
jgi:hypothetical protein